MKKPSRYDQFLLKDEISIRNFTEIPIWNVTEYDDEKGKITIFLFDSKKEIDLFLKEDR